MSAILRRIEIGPWPMNSYIIVCEETMVSAIVDPGADADQIINGVSDTKVERIIITHGHRDHIGALNQIRKYTEAPVMVHPADSTKFNIECDQPLSDGLIIKFGRINIGVIHTPGHTPGMISLSIGGDRVIVGDTIFVGGPGRTQTPDEFRITMETMKKIVFQWPDITQFYPGHGPSGKIGEERINYNRFVETGWSEHLCGDVTWA